jgi:hypothetical protein
MYSLNQVNKLVSCGRDPARSLPLWRGFLLIPLILVCFAFAPQTRAVVPAPDGFYPGFNTAEGQQALQLLTTGIGNTGLGWRALFFNNADFNTGVGAGALVLNFDGRANTAVGTASLLLNSGGSRSTSLERPRCSITQAILRQWIIQRQHTAPLRSTTTRPDSVTTLLAIPRSN